MLYIMETYQNWDPTGIMLDISRKHLEWKQEIADELIALIIFVFHRASLKPLKSQNISPYAVSDSFIWKVMLNG